MLHDDLVIYILCKYVFGHSDNATGQGYEYYTKYHNAENYSDLLY